MSDSIKSWFAQNAHAAAGPMTLQGRPGQVNLAGFGGSGNVPQDPYQHSQFEGSKPATAQPLDEWRSVPRKSDDHYLAEATTLIGAHTGGGFLGFFRSTDVDALAQAVKSRVEVASSPTAARDNQSLLAATFAKLSPSERQQLERKLAGSIEPDALGRKELVSMFVWQTGDPSFSSKLIGLDLARSLGMLTPAARGEVATGIVRALGDEQVDRIGPEGLQALRSSTSGQDRARVEAALQRGAPAT